MTRPDDTLRRLDGHTGAWAHPPKKPQRSFKWDLFFFWLAVFLTGLLAGIAFAEPALLAHAFSNCTPEGC